MASEREKERERERERESSDAISRSVAAGLKTQDTLTIHRQ